MHVNQELSVDAAQAGPARTTAAGLDAWLEGATSDPQPADTIAQGALAAAVDPANVGPVNAAEALALSLSLPTFSSPRKLTGPDGAELVVDPAQDVYYFESTSLKPLAPLLQQPASAWMPIPPEATAIVRAAESAQPLERLRWYAGLIATPGILSRRLKRSDRCKLSRWPETEREFPRHFRIAKAMLEEAATAEQIAAESGVEYESVVDYINAGLASGRLTVAKPEAPADKGPSRRQRLIARLNKPLFARK